MNDISKWILIGGLGAAGVVIYMLVKQRVIPPPPPPKQYYCEICGAGPFTSIGELTKHHMMFHPAIPPPPPPPEEMKLNITSILANDTQIY